MRWTSINEYALNLELVVAVAKKQSKLDDYITLQLSSNNSIKNTNRSGSVGQRVARSGSTRLIRPAVEPPPKPSQQQQTTGTAPSKPSTNVNDKPQLVSCNGLCVPVLSLIVKHVYIGLWTTAIDIQCQLTCSSTGLLWQYSVNLQGNQLSCCQKALWDTWYIVHYTMESLYSG